VLDPIASIGPFRRIVADVQPPMDPPNDAPRTRSTGGRAFRYAVISGIVGLLVVFLSLLVSHETSGTEISASNVSWIIFGGATGAVFGPLFALARDDGDDQQAFSDEVPVHGEADTSVDGAFAQDRRTRQQGPD
jgi:hypothetical protein